MAAREALAGSQHILGGLHLEAWLCAVSRCPVDGNRVARLAFPCSSYPFPDINLGQVQAQPTAGSLTSVCCEFFTSWGPCGWIPRAASAWRPAKKKRPCVRSRAEQTRYPDLFPSRTKPLGNWDGDGEGKMNPCEDLDTHQSNFTISRLCGNSEPEKEEEQKKWGEGTPTLDESAICGKKNF